MQRHALHVTVEEWDGVPVIRAAGELDLGTVPELRSIVHEVTALSPRVLVFDFSGVQYMDSSGLGILVSAKRRLGAYAGEVAVVTASSSVLKALKLSGLDQIIGVYAERSAFEARNRVPSGIC